MQAMNTVEVQNLEKTSGDRPVLNEISLAIHKQALLSLWIAAAFLCYADGNAIHAHEPSCKMDFGT
jgi:hypothetical protein